MLDKYKGVIMKNTIKLTITFTILMILTGCATTRGVIDINENVSINPTEGQSIKFVRVTDKRKFQIDPRQADIPSLKNDEINDTNITSRAIARKRGGFGMALGDILLPEGKTVMDVVENRLSNGFKENGYRVLTTGDTGYASATPVEIDIEKFWGWFSPGFWSIGINFQTSIIVTAPVSGFESGVEFNSEVQERFQTASGSNWLTVINMSLDELNNDIQKEIQAIHASNKLKQKSAQ